MYYVYILKSRIKKKYYIGCTRNLIERIKRHNRGKTRSTRYGIPWRLVCYREFERRGEAYEEEKRIKSYKGGNAFKKIIKGEVAEWSIATVC